MKYTPETWAREMVRKHTDVGAHRIINVYRQPMLGKDQDVVNQMAPWYERAYKWLTKNHPISLDS